MASLCRGHSLRETPAPPAAGMFQLPEVLLPASTRESSAEGRPLAAAAVGRARCAALPGPTAPLLGLREGQGRLAAIQGNDANWSFSSFFENRELCFALRVLLPFFFFYPLPFPFKA